VTKLWVYSNSVYFRKPGVGNDTFRSSQKLEVYDANAKLILDVYRPPFVSGSVDSIIHKYENNKKIRTESYVKSRLTWVDNYIYEGDNVKIYDRLFYGIFNNVPYIDTTKRIYTYKNGLLDTEEYEEKKYSSSDLYNRSLTTYNKYLKQYEYDNINKTYGYKLTVCNYFLATKPCETTEIFTSVYSKDSLYRIDKRTLYSLNKPYTTYFSETFYAYCTPTVSDVKEVLSSLDFTLFPNPTTGYFTFTLDTEGVEINNAKVQIFNLQGQEVYNTKVNNSINSIDISHLNKGFYLVKVSDKTKASVKKLVLN
jgi:Secretion system C-terminal sorting domain